MKLAVVGLGKLGLSTAACFAAAGHQVWGFDSDPRIAEALEQGRVPIREPLLADTLASAGDNLVITRTLAEAVHQALVTFIIVPTPSLPGGGFDNSLVEKVLVDLAPLLTGKDEFHVVDVVSTVSPGSCRESFIPKLESGSGLRCGRDFGLAYNPEFIALGTVITNFLNPDMVLIGASDPKTSALVRQAYETTCLSSPTIAEMSLINAEICKLSLNCFVTMKISFANELAAICELIPGADVDRVTDALGADTRIGPRCLKGGLGFGGPCFPRDNLAFAAFAHKAGWNARLSPKVVEVNRAVVARIAEKIIQNAPPGSRVAILGLSYKPGTHIVEESQSLQLALELSGEGYEVALHDPEALEEASSRLGDSFVYSKDPYSAVKGAGAVVLMTDWPEYNHLDWRRLAQEAEPGALLLDAWRLMGRTPPLGFDYSALGLGDHARQEAGR